MGRLHRVALSLAVLLCLLAGGSVPRAVVVSQVVDLPPPLPERARVALPDFERVVTTPEPVAAPPPRRVDPAPAPRSGDGRWALLIGINRVPGAPPLSGAVGDAEVLRDALVAYGYQPEQIVMLLDEQASRGAILEAIGGLADAVGDDGQAVFSFAGHTRRINGVNHLVAGDGKMIAAQTLAGALGQVQAPLWAAFPTCYAAGFSLPGIVGPGRIVTFASPSDQLAYESRAFGKSFLFQFMVEEAMVQRRASDSVQDAFEYARESLQRQYPTKVPVVDDQADGPFILGHLPSLPPPEEQAAEPERRQEPAPSASPSPSPSPRPSDDRRPPTKQPVRACIGVAGIGDCRR